jgi:hypothetical protein
MAGFPRIERLGSKFVASVDSTKYYYQTNIPCQPSTVYYFSCYQMLESGNPNATMQINWYQADGTFISTDYVQTAATATLTRMSGSKTSPALAKKFTLYVLSNTTYFIYFTDIQAEESSTLSEYMPSQDVQFAISGNKAFAADDVLEVDCEKRTVRKYTAAQAQWSNVIDESNAQFFHLNPGKNSLAFYQESATGSAEVLVRYTERYLGY